MDHTTALRAGRSTAAAESAADLPGSLAHVVDAIGATDLRRQGVTGAGVTVAVVDTGVSPVAALTVPGKIVGSVDLTPEAVMPSFRTRDGHGHGTHMAGIVAGRTAFGTERGAADLGGFAGVAPDAGLVAVKVGDRHGTVDVSQVIDGIDWVVAHRDEFRIRVLSLSYGTDSDQPYGVDPLAAAVERAWHAGIVVVVAAGNAGDDSPRLDNPATDPFVIAVGGAQPDGGSWSPLADRVGRRRST